MKKFEIELSLEQYEDAVGLLSMHAPQGWEESIAPDRTNAFLTVRVEAEDFAATFEEILKQELPDAHVTVSDEEEQDWTLAWRDFFTPINAGETFQVLPPWLENERTEGKNAIIIEPKMAFGTGHHATTALCLEAIGTLHEKGAIKPGMNFLDLGTGSGILGIGLAMIGLKGIGLDIDPQAVSCAQENIAINKVSENFSAAEGSIEAAPQDEIYDLIVANILSGPLISLAPAICKHLGQEKRLVLSGILVEQAEPVIATYKAQGLGEPVRIDRGEWTSIIWG